FLTTPMAEIIKREDEYYVRFYGNGLLFEKYAGRDRARAEALLKEITDSLPQGAMSKVVLDKDLEAFFREFQEFAAEHLNAVSAGYFNETIEHFLIFVRARLNLEPGAKLSA